MANFKTSVLQYGQYRIFKKQFLTVVKCVTVTVWNGSHPDECKNVGFCQTLIIVSLWYSKNVSFCQTVASVCEHLLLAKAGGVNAADRNSGQVVKAQIILLNCRAGRSCHQLHRFLLAVATRAQQQIVPLHGHKSSRAFRDAVQALCHVCTSYR